MYSILYRYFMFWHVTGIFRLPFPPTLYCYTPMSNFISETTQHSIKRKPGNNHYQITSVGFLILGIFHPFFLPNNSVLTFVSPCGVIKDNKFKHFYYLFFLWRNLSKCAHLVPDTDFFCWELRNSFLI